MRLARTGKDILLFGEGEERRDHVWIQDVADLTCQVLGHQSTGSLNITTGTVVSFRDIAERVTQLIPESPHIRGSVRSGPMPHNGYRAFDPSATHVAFPNFRYTSLEDGLRKYIGVQRRPYRRYRSPASLEGSLLGRGSTDLGLVILVGEGAALDGEQSETPDLDDTMGAPMGSRATALPLGRPAAREDAPG